MDTKPIDHGAIHRAIQTAGSRKALAAIAGVSQTAVAWWILGRRRPSALSTIRLESAGLVTRSELRPDLWPPETETHHANSPDVFGPLHHEPQDQESA